MKEEVEKRGKKEWEENKKERKLSIREKERVKNKLNRKE